MAPSPPSMTKKKTSLSESERNNPYNRDVSNLLSIVLLICSSEEAAEVLLRLLGEEGAVVMEAPVSSTARPCIQRDTSATFTVVVEGVSIAQSDSLEKALLLFGVCHYVFTITDNCGIV